MERKEEKLEHCVDRAWVGTDRTGSGSTGKRIKGVRVSISGEKERTSLSEIGGKEFKDRWSIFDLWIPSRFLKKLLESGIPRFPTSQSVDPCSTSCSSVY